MRRTMVVVGLLLLLAGCGAAQEAGTGATPQATSQPTQEQAVPIAAAEEAQAVLAEFLGVSSDQVALMKVEDVEWPNSALGCPAADRMYLEVITPGYQITAEVNGTTYEIHTDREGQSLVLCENGRPVDLSAGAAPEQPVEATPGGGSDVAAPEVTQQVAAALAAFLSVSQEELEIVEAREVEWSDSALGCPAPDQMYLEVITPGYQITVKAGDATYEIHTDLQGQNVVLCQDGRPVNLGMPGGGALPTEVAAVVEAPASKPAPTATRSAARQPAPTVVTDEATQPMPTLVPTEGTMSEVDRLTQIAREMLASELGVDAAAIQMQSAEAVEWSSSGLGCEKPGQGYLTVITPGYRIILEHNGHLYEYHTDRGSQVIRCDPGPRR